MAICPRLHNYGSGTFTSSNVGGQLENVRKYFSIGRFNDSWSSKYLRLHLLHAWKVWSIINNFIYNNFIAHTYSALYSSTSFCRVSSTCIYNIWVEITRLRYQADIVAAFVAGIIGIVWLSAIWLILVFPPQTELGGDAILTGERIEISLGEWGFNGLKKGGPEIEIKAGVEVTLILTNEGVNFHTWQAIMTDNGDLAGLSEDDPVNPGEIRTITIKIDEPGEYLYICSTAGHKEKGMISILRVIP